MYQRRGRKWSKREFSRKWLNPKNKNLGKCCNKNELTSVQVHYFQALVYVTLQQFKLILATCYWVNTLLLMGWVL